MSAGLDPETGLSFESVIFRGNAFEISYSEERDRGVGVAKVQTVVVDEALVHQQASDFIESLTTLVDAALVALRNPPSTFTRGDG